MSMTYEICCDDCKETLWIGQSSRIYKNDEYMNKLEKFLFKHLGHQLRFVSSEDIKVSYYDEVE